MVGQRNRIRLARLIAIGAAIAILTSVGLLVMGRSWFLSSGVENPTRTLDRPKPEESNGGMLRERHALDPVLEMARRSLALHRSRDRDYQARMIKRLRIGKKLGEPEVMRLKLRSRDGQSANELDPRPIDVYLGFLGPRSVAGREVIWRQGFDDDQLIAHETGFLNLARVYLAPSSRLAMLGNRYPISDIGIERLLIRLIEIGTRDRLLGDCQVTVREDAQCEGRRCRRIEVVHPEKTVEIRGKRFEFAYYRAEIDIDMEYELPIHYASYVWPEIPGEDPWLDEEFTYQELQLNCHLSDLDFDPNNPEYRYPSP